MSKGHGRSRTPNDQRSDSKNPTSREHKSSIDNRSNQIRESKEESENGKMVTDLLWAQI